MSDQKLLVSIIFQDHKQIGHDIEYNICVGKAAESMGINHTAILPEIWKEDPLIPENWLPCLKTGKGQFHNRLSQLLYKTFTTTRSLRVNIKERIISRNREVIFFIESFTLSYLTSFYLALNLLHFKKLKLVLLIRWNIVQDRRSFFFKHLIKKIIASYGEGSLILVTDSNLIKDVVQEYMKVSCAVLPIPHTEINYLKENIAATHIKDRPIVCWWPGFPRPTKGLDVIAKLLNEKSEYASRFKIVAGKSSFLTRTAGGAELELLDDYMERRAYQQQLMWSDIILTPYDKIYSHGTSGIFVEAVVAGKMPVTTEGTWMAYELEKYGLGMLVIDWSKPNIMETLYQRFEDLSIREKLKSMSEAYRNKHNIKNFSEALKRVMGV